MVIVPPVLLAQLKLLFLVFLHSSSVFLGPHRKVQDGKNMEMEAHANYRRIVSFVEEIVLLN